MAQEDEGGPSKNASVDDDDRGGKLETSRLDEGGHEELAKIEA